MSEPTSSNSKSLVSEGERPKKNSCQSTAERPLLFRGIWQPRSFDCGGCGKTVTLADRVDGTAYTIKTLLRSTIRPLSPGA